MIIQDPAPTMSMMTLVSLLQVEQDVMVIISYPPAETYRDHA